MVILLAKQKSKSINLTPRDKPKKQDKYSEKSKVKREYSFNINDAVIYLGLVEEYRNTLCTIVKRSRKHISEYYTIKFAIDDEILKDVAGGVLQTVEEFESNLKKEKIKENKEYDQNTISELEKEVIEKGLEPYKNPKTCLNPIAHYEHRCHKCGFENRCIYYKKYKYVKVKS